MKITRTIVATVKRMHRGGCTYRDIAERTRIGLGSVGRIVLGKYRPKTLPPATRVEIEARDALAKKMGDRGMGLPDPVDRSTDLDLGAAEQARYIREREKILKEQRLRVYNADGG